MTITFEVNQDALQSPALVKLISLNSVEGISARIKSKIEAYNSTQNNFVYNLYNDFDTINLIESTIKEETRKDYLFNIIKQQIYQGFSHPLIEAAHISYACHYPLLISPDIIWLCILQGLSQHINENPISLQERLILPNLSNNLIEIRRDNFEKGSPNNDWQGCFLEFTEKLSLLVKDNIKVDDIMNDFSTTGPIEKAVSGLAFMDCFKSYFKFGLKTLCGIPKIILTGTPKDWKKILERTEKLSQYDLEWWTNKLLPILEKIVFTSEESKIDYEFWNDLYKKQEGSGGPYVSGWINCFFPYLQNDNKISLIKNKYLNSNELAINYGPKLTNFPNGFSRVLFKWQHYSDLYYMEFLGGMFGISQDPENLAIFPNIGWAIRELKE